MLQETLGGLRLVSTAQLGPSLIQPSIMLNADKIVLTTGTTGQQSGEYIRHMLAKGWKLRALALNSSIDTALNLARQGVELSQGNLEDLAS